MVTKQEVEKILATVKDPELNIDIMTLGLIYNIGLDNGIVKIKMTLTSPFCPYGPILIDDVKNNVKNLKDVKDVEVELTFEPMWQPSEELREMLGV